VLVGMVPSSGFIPIPAVSWQIPSSKNQSMHVRMQLADSFKQNGEKFVQGHILSLFSKHNFGYDLPKYIMKTT